MESQEGKNSNLSEVYESSKQLIERKEDSNFN